MYIFALVPVRWILSVYSVLLFLFFYSFICFYVCVCVWVFTGVHQLLTYVHVAKERVSSSQFALCVIVGSCYYAFSFYHVACPNHDSFCDYIMTIAVGLFTQTHILFNDSAYTLMCAFVLFIFPLLCHSPSAH